MVLAMLLTSLICVLLAQAPPAMEDGAQITGTAGEVRLTRADNVTLASPKTVLQVGDSIASGSESGAILYWRSGITVYLGAQCQFEFVAATPLPTFKLSGGEVRLTAGNPAGIKLRTPLAEARMLRGILRAAVTAKEERFWSESGTVTVQQRELDARRRVRRSQLAVTGARDGGRGGVQQVAFQEAGAERPSITLKSGEQITIVPGEGVQKPTRGDATDWTLDVENLKRAASANASRNYRDSVAQDGINRGNADVSPGDTPDGANATQGQNNPATQISTSTGVNLSLGNTLASNAAGTAGGLFTDANQNTLAGKLTVPYQNLPAGTTFAGNIHLITGQTTYTLKDVNLAMGDGFQSGTQYWSIGLGALPTGQVTTGIGTGTGATPHAIRVQGFDAYVVKLDQFGIPDPANPSPAPGTVYAVPGLVGQTPTNPNIQGAIPLTDATAVFNPNATFALGQIALAKTTDNHPQVILRRSDQDRKIIKDPGGNDNLDQVTANPDVTGFQNVPDPLFFPSLPTVKVPDRGPNALNNLPQYRNQHALQRAAITTVTAEGLSAYSKRTGQTRFVIDGKIVDISGYKPR